MAIRILAIDDDQDILELYSLLLEEEGYESHLSSVAFEDIREVERLHPDLIILDARMGRAEDGLLLVEKLKHDASTTHIPLILCTAAPDVTGEQVVMLRQAGVSVIDKPFEVANLLQTIRHLLAASFSVGRVS